MSVRAALPHLVSPRMLTSWNLETIKMKMTAGLVIALAYASAGGQTTELEEAKHLATSSAEFTQSKDTSLEKLTADGFVKKLLQAGLGAASPASVKAASVRIKDGAKIPDASVGNRDATYDVILQPGHYGRTKGATGASGSLLSEQDIVAYLVRSVAERLRNSNYNVIVVPADNVVARDAKIFLAVHAEGSTSACSAGPSLAYKAGTSPYAMHAIGLGMSNAMGYAYGNFRADGYTKNSAQYYMYSQVNAANLTGLLEIGEITCQITEEKMIVNIDRIATNLAISLDYILRLN